MGKLLTRILPEVSKYIEDPIYGINNNDSQDSPGRYFSKATLSHEEFLKTGTEKAALEAAQNYYKVHTCFFVLLFVINIPAMTLIWKFVLLVY